MTDQETIEGYESLITDLDKEISVFIQRKVNTTLKLARFKDLCKQETELNEKYGTKVLSSPVLHPIFDGIVKNLKAHV